MSGKYLVQEIINVEKTIDMLIEHKKKLEAIIPVHILISAKHHLTAPEQSIEQYLEDKKECEFLEYLKPEKCANCVHKIDKKLILGEYTHSFAICENNKGSEIENPELESCYGFVPKKAIID